MISIRLSSPRVLGILVASTFAFGLGATLPVNARPATTDHCGVSTDHGGTSTDHGGTSTDHGGTTTDHGGGGHGHHHRGRTQVRHQERETVRKAHALAARLKACNQSCSELPQLKAEADRVLNQLRSTQRVQPNGRLW